LPHKNIEGDTPKAVGADINDAGPTVLGSLLIRSHAARRKAASRVATSPQPSGLTAPADLDPKATAVRGRVVDL
jgi:hypothetical protein